MSKEFKTQDYFRYPRLGKRWRRPKGLQSKLRLKKGGSGRLVSIGYRTKASERGKVMGMEYIMVSNAKDLEGGAKLAVIASGVGARKALQINERAKELGVKILNMRKVRRSARIAGRIKKRKDTKANDKIEKKAGKEKQKGEAWKKTEENQMDEIQLAQEKKADDKKSDKIEESKAEKKMGFDEDVVPQVLGGKTKTYRLRDHGLKVGDKVVFQNTQKEKTFGHAKITKIEKVPVEKFNLKDPEHYVVYNSTEELIEALRKRNPDKEVTPKTEMFAYTYEFTPLKDEK
jgi:large subunit ribosomal protein L32e